MVSAAGRSKHGLCTILEEHRRLRTSRTLHLSDGRPCAAVNPLDWTALLFCLVNARGQDEDEVHMHILASVNAEAIDQTTRRATELQLAVPLLRRRRASRRRLLDKTDVAAETGRMDRRRAAQGPDQHAGQLWGQCCRPRGLPLGPGRGRARHRAAAAVSAARAALRHAVPEAAAAAPIFPPSAGARRLRHASRRRPRVRASPACSPPPVSS